MTLKELSQLYYLNREIEDLKNKISELEEKATDTSVKITGMPHGAGAGDKIGRAVAELDYYKAKLMIYDNEGNLVAQTELKQCKYGLRTWSK